MIRPFIKKIPFIVYILIGAAIMRLINLSSLSLSNDELSALARLRYDSVGEMIREGVYIDFHPAGVQLFLYYWVKIFGNGVFFFRLPFVLFSLGTIYLIYKTGVKWYGETTALCAAAAFSFLPYTLQLSQFARMYSPGAFFSLLACYGWMNYLFYSGQKKYLWMWFTGMLCCIHIHYFSFLFVALLGLSGLFFLKKEKVRPYLLAGFFAVLTFALEWKIFMEQMKTGDIGGWLQAPDRSFLLRFFAEALNHSYFLYLLYALLLITGFLKIRDGKWRWRWLSLGWFLLSFLVAYVYSVLGHPILQFSTLYFTYPFILLFIFSFIPARLETNSPYVFVFLMCINFISSTIATEYYTKPRFGIFKEVVEDVNRLRAEKGLEIPFVVNVINPYYYQYYSVDTNGDRFNIYKVETSADIGQLSKTVASSTADYFGYAWTNSIHPYEVIALIREKYPNLVYRRAAFNSSVYLFSRKEAGRSDSLLFSTRCDFNSEFWNADKASQKPFLLTTEYGPGIERRISDLTTASFAVLDFTARFRMTDTTKEANLIISVERNHNFKMYYGVKLNDFVLEKDSFTSSVASAVLTNFDKDDTLKAYILNGKKDTIFIDEMTVKVRIEEDPFKK